MSEKKKPKIGEGHASAMLRTGFTEARNTLYPESNVASRTAEYGIAGTLTPGEVAEARRSQALGLDQENPKEDSILGSRLGPVHDRGVHGREIPERDR